MRKKVALAKKSNPSPSGGVIVGLRTGRTVDSPPKAVVYRTRKRAAHGVRFHGMGGKSDLQATGEVLGQGSRDAFPIVSHGSGRSLQLRAQLKITRETFARLLAISTRQLASIEAGLPPTPHLARRLRELQRIVHALGEVIQPDAVGPWLEQPNDAFDGLKPLEVIERGEVDRIWEMVYFLRSGDPS